MLGVGQVPECLNDHIIQDITKLRGEWIEYDKPNGPVQEIMGRLGIGAMKRKIAARCKCTMTIEVNEGHNDTPRIKKLDHEDEEASSDTEPITQPSTPLRQKSEEITLRWRHKQFFPLGIEKEAEFVSDGMTELISDDKDTGQWTTIAIVADNGCLIQRRVSEQLGLTMFDTRCLIKNPVKLDQLQQGKLEFADENSDEGRESLYQLFQWKLIDHKNENKIYSCSYHLRQTSPEPTR